MGPLRQHSAVEFRRYFLRFLHVVPVIDTMADVWRMRLNQREGLAAPIRKLLTEKGVHFNPGTVVKDMTFRAAGRDVFTNSIRLSTGETAVPMTEKDAVLVTLGSQVANMRKGTTTTAPTSPPSPADAWRLWTQITENARTQLGREDFGDPTEFFKAGDPSSTWVTFTITLRDRLFFERLTALSGSGPRRQGLVTLINSPWLITLAPLPHPHFLGQPGRPGVRPKHASVEAQAERREAEKRSSRSALQREGVRCVCRSPSGFLERGICSISRPVQRHSGEWPDA